MKKWVRKYRQKKSYLKKKYRSKYQSSKSSWKRKTKKAKPVSGRMRVKGVKRPIDKKTELKRIVYMYSNAGVGDTYTLGSFNNLTTIWSTVGQDVSGSQVFFSPPNQGADVTEFIGDTINMKYVELTFFLFPSLNYNPLFSFTCFRLMMLRSRVKGQSVGWANIFYSQNITSPIDAKKWDIMYDKLFVTGSGRISAGPPSRQVSLTKPYNFRIVIPLKLTVNLKNIIAPFSVIDDEIFLLGTALNANNEWNVYNPVAIWHYTDP